MDAILVTEDGEVLAALLDDDSIRVVIAYHPAQHLPGGARQCFSADIYEESDLTHEVTCNQTFDGTDWVVTFYRYEDAEAKYVGSTSGGRQSTPWQAIRDYAERSLHSRNSEVVEYFFRR